MRIEIDTDGIFHNTKITINDKEIEFTSFEFSVSAPKQRRKGLCCINVRREEGGLWRGPNGITELAEHLEGDSSFVDKNEGSS